MMASRTCHFQHAADLFGLRAFGNIYSRIGNPTVVRASLVSRAANLGLPFEKRMVHTS
jgi:O-acetylhomoserine/O-acetylserine sulfhydrylase-like pyridoxal-dependent enzyme